VRKERLLRRTSDLRSLYNRSRHGCPASYFVPHDLVSDLTQKPVPPGCRWLPQNPFTVQAVIDVLKLSPKYSSLTHIVPGEADTFAARLAYDVPSAFILTGDSDLLIYDIGKGRVVFLDDITLFEVHTAPTCVSFSPLAIETKLGLAGNGPPSRIRRFAFELLRQPHASLAQLLAECKEPIDKHEYARFDQLYQYERGVSPSSWVMSCPLALDARFVEVALYFRAQYMFPSHQMECALNTSDAAPIFLPSLHDSCERSSCFSASEEVRQIAYSVLCIGVDSPCQGVQEFRRLHVPGGCGVAIPILPPADLLTATRYLAEVLSRVVRLLENDGNHFWPAITLGLDICSSRARGKAAMVVKTVGTGQRTGSMASSLPWDLVHFKSQVDACCYSFRLLSQALCLVRQCQPSQLVETIYDLMAPFLCRISCLQQFPRLEQTQEFLAPAVYSSHLARILRTLDQEGLTSTDSLQVLSPGKGLKHTHPPLKDPSAISSQNSFGLLVDNEE
jgi:hypothetical protein